jgi:hypothetical protein
VADAKAEAEYEALGGEEEVKAEDVPF